MATLALALTCGFAASAVADSLSDPAGTITLSTIGAVTVDTPYSSGQTINVTLHANKALGFDNGAAGPYNIEECQAPNGVLPTVPTSNCDGLTIVQVSAVNADGSLGAKAYKIYSLPDVPTFSEKAGTGQPTCGVAPNDCVLYIGSPIGAATSFPSAHLFSAPFFIASNGDDEGGNPGDGVMAARSSSTTVPVVANQAQPTAKTKATPASTAAIAASRANASASSATRAAGGAARASPLAGSSDPATTPGSLAFTGTTPTLAWLALSGALLMLASSFALRRARRRINSPWT
jgi:hypothetical protein